jgi:hypothetical protein
MGGFCWIFVEQEDVVMLFFRRRKQGFCIIKKQIKRKVYKKPSLHSPRFSLTHQQNLYSPTRPQRNSTLTTPSPLHQTEINPRKISKYISPSSPLTSSPHPTATASPTSTLSNSTNLDSQYGFQDPHSRKLEGAPGPVLSNLTADPNWGTHIRHVQDLVLFETQQSTL